MVFATRLRIALAVGIAVQVAVNGVAALAVEPFPDAAPIAADTLRQTSGREDLNQISQASQAATVSGSSVNGTSTTGAITIDGNAYQNLSGLSVLNANTGNNVAINAAMNVNISIIPPR